MVKKVVIKLGTGILSAGKGKIHEARLAKLANGIHAVGKSSKTQVIVVSSGAVGLGMGKLGLDSRPTDLAVLRRLCGNRPMPANERLDGCTKACWFGFRSGLAYPR